MATTAAAPPAPARPNDSRRPSSISHQCYYTTPSTDSLLPYHDNASSTYVSAKSSIAETVRNQTPYDSQEEEEELDRTLGGDARNAWGNTPGEGTARKSTDTASLTSREGDSIHGDGEDDGTETETDEFLSYPTHLSSLRQPSTASIALPPSPSLQSTSSSMEGTSSEESTTFGLQSPFPRVAGRKLNVGAGESGGGKESQRVRKSSFPRPKGKENVDPKSPAAAAAATSFQPHQRSRSPPSGSHVTVQGGRVQMPGFPYADSSSGAAVTFASSSSSPTNSNFTTHSRAVPFSSASGSSPALNKDARDSSLSNSTISPKHGVIAHLAATSSAHERTDSKGSGESSDLDLDLSFDYQDTSASSSAGGGRSVDSHASSTSSSSSRPLAGIGGGRSHSDTTQPVASNAREWVGIPILPLGGLPERELVRSSSGRLLGTRGKVRSAIDLRAESLEAERKLVKNQARKEGGESETRVVMMMDFAGGNVGSEGGMMEEGKRQVQRKGKRAMRGSAGSSTMVPFSFNATPAIPEPLHSDSSPNIGTKSALKRPSSASPSPRRPSTTTKHFPLPLKLVDKRNTIATPSTAAVLVEEEKGSGSPRSPAWSVSSFFHRLGGGGSPRTVQSVTQSPLFEVHTPGMDTDTSSVHERYEGERRYVIEQDCGNSEEEEEMETEEMEDERGRQQLHGLGFNFSSSGLGRSEDDLGGLSSRSLSPLTDGGDVPRRYRHEPHHATIPSLSLSPPPSAGLDGFAGETSSSPFALVDSDGSDGELDSEESAVNPKGKSPSARLSESLARADRDQVARRASSRTGMPTLQAPPQGKRNGRRSPSPSSLSSRFSFRPAPLTLVQEDSLRGPAGRAQSGDGYTHIRSHSRSTSIFAPRLGHASHAGQASRFSLASVQDYLVNVRTPSSMIDEIVPAKLLFLSAFLLGPWCWLIGGWFFRPLDGEHRGARGVRCRERKCGCGMVVKHVGGAAAARMHHGGTKEELWRGLDKWVFLNRVAASATGVSLVVLIAVAIWAAAVA